MNLVFFPFHDYKLSLKEGFRTRDAHIYSKAIDNKLVENIIIINRPTLLLEVALSRKSMKTTGEIVYSSNRLTIQKVKDNLFVIDILDFSIVKPIKKGKGFISELYYRNRELIKKSLDTLNCCDFTSYESSPLTRETVNFLQPSKKVFDGVDNFCKHDSYSLIKEELKAEYHKIIESYEKIYFNGKDSLDFFNCSDNERVQFMANGVDYERFQNKYSLPEQYKSSKSNQRKVAVYAGKMQSMFDTKLVAYLARKNPEVDFFFLGKILEGQPDKDLQEYRNVTFTGDIHYDLLPSYITHADICIIPYLVEKQHGGDPIKFYEYLASGATIVSTCIGDIEKYHDGKSVFIVDKNTFVDSFNLAVKSSLQKEKRNIPEHMTWQYKANDMFNFQ